MLSRAIRRASSRFSGEAREERFSRRGRGSSRMPYSFFEARILFTDCSSRSRVIIPSSTAFFSASKILQLSPGSTPLQGPNRIRSTPAWKAITAASSRPQRPLIAPMLMESLTTRPSKPISSRR